MMKFPALSSFAVAMITAMPLASAQGWSGDDARRRGALHALVDIKARKFQILGSMWGAPKVDPISGFRVCICLSCTASYDEWEEARGYNQAMRAWAKEHPEKK